MADGRLKAAYDKQVTERDHYWRRAQQAARYTIPSLAPADGMTKSTALYTPYQGLGQRGLNNLSSKLLLILMPVEQPMFVLDVDDFQMQELLKASPNPEAARGELDEAFNRVERAVWQDLAATDLRKSLAEGIKQLLVAGNVAIFQDEEGGAQVWRLNQFVVRRNHLGMLLQLIIHEEVDPETLTVEQKAVYDATAADSTAAGDMTGTDVQMAQLYTAYTYLPGQDRYHLEQELNGLPVPGSVKTFPAEKSPMLVPTTNRLPGENYGRGYIETVCLGDLISFEGLSKYLLDGAASAAKILWMRNPNSATRAKDLEKPNNSIINGSPNDVAALRLEKGNDFNFAMQFAQNIERRLEQVFLLNQSVQRDAERVTATEIQFVAQDIEDALGNLYTDMAGGLQLPLVNFQLARLTRKKRIPALPKGVVRPRITTGLSALGRGQDLRKMQAFITDLKDLGGENAIALVKSNEMVKRLGAAHGIDMMGLIKSAEEQAAEAEAQQQAMMREKMMGGPVAGEVAKQVGPMIAQQMGGQQAPTE